MAQTGALIITIPLTEGIEEYEMTGKSWSRTPDAIPCWISGPVPIQFFDVKLVEASKSTTGAIFQFSQPIPGAGYFLNCSPIWNNTSPR